MAVKAGLSGIGETAGPYLLLSFSVLCWSGTLAVGKLASVDVPPVTLSFWRHLLAALLVIPFIIPQLHQDWPVIRRHGRSLLLLSALFVAGNTLVFVSVRHTTVINAALINAGVPVAAAMFSWVFLRDIINRWQALGIVACFLGIATVVTRGQLEILLALEYSGGDLYMLGAVLCWALYMVLLKRTSIMISPWSLLVILATGGSLCLLPVYLVEVSHFGMFDLSMLAVISLLYVACFSTVLAYACWNSGTLRIGPNRASAFMCLHPLYGAVLGMLVFGEVVRGYHGIGTILVLAGIVMVSRNYERKTAASGS